ncbi:L-lysine 6-monooxygenase (NADPH-requiring)-domain-containing protein [Podospora didyma]|uniref:L-ornithine N(5)-monooxygenase [NAD(P)H] n=1 Tax=Podospora didyma TaxID=330526 RepID=A0AAE0NGB9_9PEZI|nr:L-lysine 6-monooxygenase (NADPH-requiring)-domain-containing protein [Podospora didyma]
MSPHSTLAMDDVVPEIVNGSMPGVHDATDSASVTSDAVPELVSGSSSTIPATAAMNGVNGTSNDVSNNLRTDVPKSQYLKPADTESVLDMLCIGFGPASLAIAVALHDSMEGGTLKEAPKVLFLEKQPQFAWHAGMLLPGAKMQISFIKDMASLRNPRSNFTFINYLHMNDRLVEFTNLDTFLPARVEYEDYLRWCSRHFDDLVQYQSEVVSVSPIQDSGPHKTFSVTSRNSATGVTSTYLTRNVICAIGGQASIPKPFPERSPRVIHSSQYSQMAPKILTDVTRPYRVAVVGAGQSAAEIFNNVQNLYPNSKTYLIMRSEWLKPSDDSPFVNSIFNPAYTDIVYPMSSGSRASLLAGARATNYGVVRLELIEHLYEKMYHQRRTLGTDEKTWPHRILAGQKVLSVGEKGEQLQIKVALASSDDEVDDGLLLGEEMLDVDLVICATGYKRTAHLDMLKDSWSLLPEISTENGVVPPVTKDRWLLETESSTKGSATSTRVLEVGRDYGVRFSPGAVAPGSGVWLQGCCEGTHGVSNPLPPPPSFLKLTNL